MAVSKAQGTLVQVKGSHLIVESLGEEVVVFDRRTNKAHLLDPRAAAVWGAAENGCSFDEVVGLVKGDSPEERTSVAHLAISDLKRAGLLISDAPVPQRRRLLKTLGAVAALPMVISILAPTPASAASNLNPGGFCTEGVDSCTTPFMGNVFLCQDPMMLGVNQGRCCWDQPTRTDVQLMGGVCNTDNDCCSFSNCVTMACQLDF